MRVSIYEVEPNAVQRGLIHMMQFSLMSWHQYRADERWYVSLRSGCRSSLNAAFSLFADEFASHVTDSKTQFLSSVSSFGSLSFLLINWLSCETHTHRK